MSKHLFKENKFGIRKFTVGTASIIIGATLYLGVPHHDAHAAEQTPQDQISSISQTKYITTIKSSNRTNTTYWKNNTSYTSATQWKWTKSTGYTSKIVNNKCSKL